MQSVSLIDSRFCVYIHISSNGDIFYVGEGTNCRCSDKTGRNSEWRKYAEDGYEYLILYDNLSKYEAVKLENKVITQLLKIGHPLVNRRFDDGVKLVTREIFNDYLEIDENSPSGLSWKINRGRMKAGDCAGMFHKETGYYIVMFNHKSYKVHRIIYALYHGECPVNLNINHIDSNRANNTISNLEAVTQSDNVLHSFKQGRKPIIGEDHGQSKLREEDVLEIYKLSKEGVMGKDIANIFNISKALVSVILNGKNWKHLYEEFPE